MFGLESRNKRFFADIVNPGLSEDWRKVAEGYRGPKGPDNHDHPAPRPGLQILQDRFPQLSHDPPKALPERIAGKTSRQT